MRRSSGVKHHPKRLINSKALLHGETGLPRSFPNELSVSHILPVRDRKTVSEITGAGRKTCTWQTACFFVFFFPMSAWRVLIWRWLKLRLTFFALFRYFFAPFYFPCPRAVSSSAHEHTLLIFPQLWYVPSPSKRRHRIGVVKAAVIIGDDLDTDPVSTRKAEEVRGEKTHTSRSGILYLLFAFLIKRLWA